jgi:hypothetical protein
MRSLLPDLRMGADHVLVSIMKSKYGQVCAKHPELAGRRYLLSNNCIKCHNERSKANHARRKALLEELLEAAHQARQWSPRLDKALEAYGYGEA